LPDTNENVTAITKVNVILFIFMNLKCILIYDTKMKIRWLKLVTQLLN
jgi:hypothetical protein